MRGKHKRALVPPEKRFWAKVKKGDPAQCWIWMGTLGHKGHGTFRVNSKKNEGAHRFSYQSIYGEIPKGMCICHSCDNPSCVNPLHLWVGTRSDNNTDRANKGRSACGEGEYNNLSKLKNSQVIRIRELLKEGWTQCKIAEIFGVSQSQISHIKLGKAWSHVLPDKGEDNA